MKMLLTAVFLNNIVLISFLGLEGILLNTQKSRNAFGVIMSSIFIAAVSSYANFYIYNKLLVPFELEILVLLVFSVSILLVSLIVAWFLEKLFTIMYKEIREFIPVVSVSSLILGSSILNLQKTVGVNEYMYLNFCNMLGFALVIILLVTINDKMTTAKLPENVKGAPILLIILGLISMAFMGFMGVSAHS